MDLINWSLSAIDTIFSARSQKKFRRREQLSKVSQGCPFWLKLWEERSALRLRLLTGIWIPSRWWSSQLCKWKCMLSGPEWTERTAVKLCSCSPQRQNKSILSFLARPRPCWITTLGRALQRDSLAPSPDYRHYSPSRPTAPDRFVPPGLSSGSATSALINGTGPDGCLPELDMSPCCKVMCLWYMCFCAEVFFSVLTLYSSMEHSLGVNFFFSPLFPHVML